MMEPGLGRRRGLGRVGAGVSACCTIGSVGRSVATVATLVVDLVLAAAHRATAAATAG